MRRRRPRNPATTGLGTLLFDFERDAEELAEEELFLICFGKLLLVSVGVRCSRVLLLVPENILVDW
jgi:hypothetical protein